MAVPVERGLRGPVGFVIRSCGAENAPPGAAGGDCGSKQRYRSGVTASARRALRGARAVPWPRDTGVTTRSPAWRDFRASGNHKAEAGTVTPRGAGDDGGQARGTRGRGHQALCYPLWHEHPPPAHPQEWVLRGQCWPGGLFATSRVRSPRTLMGCGDNELEAGEGRSQCSLTAAVDWAMGRTDHVPSVHIPCHRPQDRPVGVWGCPPWG